MTSSATASAGRSPCWRPPGSPRVRRCVTFQAPGIDAASAAALSAHNKVSDEPIESTHYVTAGDFISLTGEEKTEGTVYKIDKVGIPTITNHGERIISDLAEVRLLPFDGIEQNEEKEVENRIVNISDGDTSTVGTPIAFHEIMRKWGGRRFKQSLAFSAKAAAWEKLTSAVEAAFAADTPLEIKDIEVLIDGMDDLALRTRGQFKASIRSLYG